MPDQKAQATFQRRMLVLEAIRSLSRGRRGPNDRWVKASELVTYLADQGYPVEKHNVLRDLRALQQTYSQLECNDNSASGQPKRGEAYGWIWRGTDPPPDAGLTIPEALSVVLVERYLRQTVPASLTRAFESLFRQAENTLALHGKSPESHWLQKVCVVEPSQPLAAPKIDDAILATVHDSLLKERQLKVIHAGPGKSPKKALLNPLGLVMRGQTTYLVAMPDGTDKVLFYALHRIREASLTDVPAKRCWMEMDEYVDEHGHFGSGTIIRVRMRVATYLANLLIETPLSPDQKISDPDADGKYIIEADVRDTWQLRWWILGRGGGIEILAPENLREAISQELCAAVALYG